MHPVSAPPSGPGHRALTEPCCVSSRVEAECVECVCASSTCTQRRAWSLCCGDGWLILPEFTAAVARQRRLVTRCSPISANKRHLRAWLQTVLSEPAASSSSHPHFPLLPQPKVKVNTYPSQPPLKNDQRRGAHTSLCVCVSLCLRLSLSPLFLTVLFLPFYISFHK